MAETERMPNLVRVDLLIRHTQLRIYCSQSFLTCQNRVLLSVDDIHNFVRGPSRLQAAAAPRSMRFAGCGLT